MEHLVPLFEGFLTYGGISVREIEAMAVGLYETTDLTVISQSPSFIEYFIGQMVDMGIPCVTPAGGLGAHIDAGRFLPHIPQEDYPAGALAAAFFIASGVRGMERGTLSSVRDENGKDILADVELLRLAFPRRVFTLSQVKYVADRMKWLYDNRDLIGGLEFVEEPPVLRFFMGKLRAKSDWPENWRPNTAGTSGKACKGWFSRSIPDWQGLDRQVQPLLRWGRRVFADITLQCFRRKAVGIRS